MFEKPKIWNSFKRINLHITIATNASGYTALAVT